MEPINPNAPSFFPQFYDKHVAQTKPLESWLLVFQNGGFSLEKKEGLSIFRLYRKIRGASYDLECNSRRFLVAVAGPNDNKDELKAKIRSCFFVQQLLKKARLKKNNLRALSKEYKTRCVELAGQYAHLAHLAELTAACEHTMFAHAITLIEAGADIQDAKGHYNELLEQAFTKQKTGLCFTFVDAGAIPQSQKMVDVLLEAAIAAGKSATAVKLVQHCSTIQHTFLQQAAARGLLDVAKALLQKGANVNAQDQQNSTALHAACKMLHFEMAMLLVRYGGDVSALDNNKKTPFQLPLSSTLEHAKNRFYSLLFASSPFIEKKIKTNGIGPFLQYAKSSPKDLLSHCKGIFPLEVAYLLNDAALASKLAQHYTKKDFLAALDHLQAKYPSSALDFVYFCHIGLNREHLLNVPELDNSPPKRPIRLQALFILLDSFDFHLLNKNYFISKRKVKNALTEFITRIEGRVTFLGNTKHVEETYSIIENAVKNILIYFEDSQNPKEDEPLKVAFIREICSIVFLCGGRYVASIAMLFHKICKKQDLSLADMIMQSLAEYRYGILVSTLDSQNEHNVNEFNGFMRMRGKQLGIPGAKTMEKYTDPLGFCKIEEKERAFFEIYTPRNIQIEWVTLLLNDDGALREAYIDWHKAQLPPGTSDAQKHAYIGSTVYAEDGKLAPLAISQFLCRIGVLTSSLL